MASWINDVSWLYSVGQVVVVVTLVALAWELARRKYESASSAMTPQSRRPVPVRRRTHADIPERQAENA